MSQVLHERARRMRQRIAVRRWEYRQRNHAQGVWFRLRRVLAEAERAFVASDEQILALLAEGIAPEPVGLELQPTKSILFLSSERIATLGPLREIPIHLNAELLTARCLLLVRFPRTT